MLQYLVGFFVLISMVVFTVGAAFLASEEKQYRYDVDVTDEHEI
jgi:hypothetical protein